MGIIRVETAYGTNHREIQYYDVTTKTLSKSFLAPSAYADYLSGDTCKFANLIATFSYDANQRTILVIYDIFSAAIIATIQRDFIASTSGANKISFLSENIIFIDYDIIDSNDIRTNNKEIILFRHNDDSVTITEEFAGDAFS
jgi:hypothetical protein